jgi:hypothetical protein
VTFNIPIIRGRPSASSFARALAFVVDTGPDAAVPDVSKAGGEAAIMAPMFAFALAMSSETQPASQLWLHQAAELAKLPN